MVVYQRYFSNIDSCGRSGKFGRRNVTIFLATDYEMHTIQRLIKLYNTEINELPENFAVYL